MRSGRSLLFMASKYKRFRRLFLATTIPWSLCCLALAGLLVFGAKDNLGTWHENDLWIAARCLLLAVISPAIIRMFFVIVPWIARGFNSETTSS